MSEDPDRAEFLRFVRENHPDVGGDPEVFTAGVAGYLAARRGAARPGDPVDRYDSPVVGVPHRGLLTRLADALRRRRRPPRVR